MDATKRERKDMRLNKKDFGGNVLVCPFCSTNNWGNVFNHFNHKDGVVHLLDGNDNYEAKGDVVRGDVVQIDFYCESGHFYSLFFGFHKGTMFVWTELTSNKDIV